MLHFLNRFTTWKTLGVGRGDPVDVGPFLWLELIRLLSSILVHFNDRIPVVNTISMRDFSNVGRSLPVGSSQRLLFSV